MDGSQGHYAKWNKSVREIQIPYDFSYEWNLKKKIKIKKKAELLATANR